jgi:hypothetical protein
MNRLKFLLFAFVALGLWGYHLVFAPAASMRLSEQGAGALLGAAPAVALAVEARRSELQTAVLRVASSPSAWNAGPKSAGRPEAPAVDRFNAVRALVLEALPEASRAEVVIALVNEAGALVAVGPAEPGAAPAGFDVGAVAQAGAAGVSTTSGTTTWLFNSTPMLVSDKNEVRTAGSIAVGLPLLPDVKQLEGVAKDLRLSTLAVVSSGAVLRAAGPDKSQAALAIKTLKPGQVTPLVSGSVRVLGPLSFPLFVDAPSQSVGVRQAIAGTPFEVLAVVSTREPLDALAAFQIFGVASFAGLLLLAIAIALLLKEEDEGGGMAVPPPMPMPPMTKKEPGPPTPVAAQHATGPEASPDDFHFPPSPAASSPSSFVVSGPSMAPAAAVAAQPPGSNAPTATGPALVIPEPAPAFVAPPSPASFQPFEEPEVDPFASAAPPPSNPPVRVPSAPVFPPARPSSKPPPPVANPFEDDEGARTVAYPTFRSTPLAQPAPPAGPPATDPFATAVAEPQTSAFDDSPEATRVSAVPQELLKATRAGGALDRALPPARPSGPMPRMPGVAAAGGADAEEKHFQDVFRDFVAAREKCGEPADGLTYEKFKAKLLKNRDQLVAKYQCRTVRFQVYVKEGKAALKATPVKD